MTARITYDLTFWAGGSTMPFGQTTWTSAPTSLEIGELRTVNVIDAG